MFFFDEVEKRTKSFVSDETIINVNLYISVRIKKKSIKIPSIIIS